jgi:N utilization substance protein B
MLGFMMSPDPSDPAAGAPHAEQGSRRVRPSAAARSTARLAAVQALYQLSLNAGSADQVIGEFRAFRLGRPLDGDRYEDADPELFAAIVRGATAGQPAIGALLADLRPGDRPLDRLEPLLRVVLEAGAWELAECPGMRARAVIGDYVGIAHAFFAGPEPGIVNAVLDRLARRLRPGELPPAPGAAGEGEAAPDDGAPGR